MLTTGRRHAEGKHLASTQRAFYRISMQLVPEWIERGLTRSQVAAKLGISTSSVRRLEWVQLHPSQNATGVWLFDPDEVARVSPQAQRLRTEPSVGAVEERSQKRRGRLAARVFLMFARSRSISEIVVATKQPPEVIRELYREWSTSLEEAEWDRRSRA